MQILHTVVRYRGPYTVGKGIQAQTVTLNLSEPKNRHVAQKPGAESATRMTVTASVWATAG